jgi:hypothetical protein
MGGAEEKGELTFFSIGGVRCYFLKVVPIQASTLPPLRSLLQIRFGRDRFRFDWGHGFLSLIPEKREKSQ